MNIIQILLKLLSKIRYWKFNDNTPLPEMEEDDIILEIPKSYQDEQITF